VLVPRDFRVEQQAEVSGRRVALYPLVSTADGLARWLDEAEIQPKVGAKVRLRLRDGIAVGTVIAVDPPQHISWTWDWEAEPLRSPSVVAFDLIDHAERTHLTVRQVGLRTQAQRDVHDALWRYWFGRLREQAEMLAASLAERKVTQPE
jgi:uncharacterized protein YndB with AHSA1/START domain